jgi:hypothetical protein
VKKWVETKSHEAYTYKEAVGEFANLTGEDSWMSLRSQLEGVVNRVKRRKTSH